MQPTGGPPRGARFFRAVGVASWEREGGGWEWAPCLPFCSLCSSLPAATGRAAGKRAATAVRRALRHGAGGWHSAGRWWGGGRWSRVHARWSPPPGGQTDPPSPSFLSGGRPTRPVPPTPTHGTACDGGVGGGADGSGGGGGERLPPAPSPPLPSRPPFSCIYRARTALAAAGARRWCRRPPPVLPLLLPLLRPPPLPPSSRGEEIERGGAAGLLLRGGARVAGPILAALPLWRAGSPGEDGGGGSSNRPPGLPPPHPSRDARGWGSAAAAAAVAVWQRARCASGVVPAAACHRRRRRHLCRRRCRHAAPDLRVTARRQRRRWPPLPTVGRRRPLGRHRLAIRRRGRLTPGGSSAGGGWRASQIAAGA